MKRLIFTLGIVIFFQFLLIGQNNHTYGPVRDQHWADVQDPNGGDHFVGRNSNGQGITYYNFVNWQWTYNNIPNATNLTSINIKFKAQYEDYSSHAFHFTLHYIESNWSGIDLSYYFNQVGYNNNRKVFEDNVSSDAGGVLTYNKTITSGALFDSVQAAITRGRYFVTLAFRSEDGTSPWWELYPYDGNVTQSDSPSIDLTLNFTTINQNYQLVNNIESSENYGTLKYFNNSNSTFGADSSGMIVGLDPNCNYSIRTNELPFIVNYNNTGYTEKHKQWNVNSINYDTLIYNLSPNLSKINSKLSAMFLQGKTAIIQTNLAEGSTGGTVNLYDPWHYYTDGQGNWVQSKTFNSYSSPLNIQNNSTSSYGGVFLNISGPTNNWSSPYYSISVPSVQTISVNGVNHTFYFQNWTASNAAVQNAGSTQTPVVFTSDGSVVSANYKGHLLSNNTAGLSTNCQSKVITDDFGNYDLVYESLGNVWFTRSTDGGNTWAKEIKVNLDGTQAKCPSISCPNDGVGFLFITYESDCDAVGWPTRPSILLNEYKNNSFVSITSVDTVSNYSFNSYPVVTSINTYILVVYKAGPASNLRAVEFRNQVTGSYTVTVNQTFNSLPATNTNSINPSLTSQELVSPKYFLAFEQSDTNAIRYLEWPVGSNVMNYTPVNISNGNGGYYNHYPSISQNSGNAVVSWTGTVGPYPVAVIKRKNNGIWTSFYKASGYMTTTSNNSRKYTGEGAYIAWLNTYSLQNPVTQFIELDSNVFSQIATLPSAADVRLSDGNNMSDIRAIQFFNTTLPYVVQPHGVSLHTNLGKANSNTDIRYGRSAIVSVEGTEYEFFLGGIKLNGQNILFNKIKNTTPLRDIDGLSNSLVTQKFTLNENSNFSFDSHSHIIKHLQVDSSGNKNKAVSFAIELISSKDNSTVGRFNPVILAKDNDSNDVNINVNCKGIQTGDYYFRVAIKTDNQVSSFDIADYQYEYISSLMKKESSNLDYTGDPPIKEYDLCQNYPNPFNPSTVIEYQLPKDGYVTLKVYDILGREVRTLVDGYKTVGKYSVSFDGSKLASGVYIYQLKSNNYNSIKKMILTK